MRDELASAVAAAIKKLFGIETNVELSRPDEKFGDFSSSIALQLARETGKNPREIAEAIAGELNGNELIADVETAGPGFINMKLSDEALWRLAEQKPPESLKGQVVVAEYSDPNPFKILHAGHLYTTLVGDAIANLLASAGATVHRLNYGGDVGLHVGKTMWAILQELGGEEPDKLSEIEANERLSWLSSQYVKGNNAYEEDEQAKVKIQELNKKIYQIIDSDDHASELAQIYWTCREWSYQGFDKLYQELGIKPFERYIGESESTPAGLEIVKKGLASGVFEQSDGAVVYKGEEKGLHTRVFITSQGLPTYEAKDLGLAALKWRDYKFDLSFIITGNDIQQYMQVVLAALENFHPEIVKRSRHLTHGMIKMPGGVKMSSRLGNILTADDIIAAAGEAQIKTFGKRDVKAELGAIKYALLRQRIGGDIIFDPAESVSIEGNSGPYLQYAHARARSIIAKATKSPSRQENLDEHERSLLCKIGEYGEHLESAKTDLMPHHICVYLYDLAQKFNSFYENSKVVGDPREAVRLELVTLYGQTLKNGLNLLGIEAPEKM